MNVLCFKFGYICVEDVLSEHLSSLWQLPKCKRQLLVGYRIMFLIPIQIKYLASILIEKRSSCTIRIRKFSERNGKKYFKIQIDFFLAFMYFKIFFGLF